MAGGKKGVNQKAEAAKSQKAEQEAKKQAEKDRQLASQEAAEWRQGANTRKLVKDEEYALKADEAARRRREKAELLAQEEVNLGISSTAAKKPMAKPKKKQPKSDLAMLEDALQSAADKKVRQKKQELMQKQQEEKRKLNDRKDDNETPLDPLLANTEAMIGFMRDDGDDELVGRNANKQRMEDEIGATGIDAALGSLQVSIPGGVPNQVMKSAKALYHEFETRMLPVVKEEYPGLRLTQYKEKVWQLWKKSPDNPANQVVPP